MILPYTTKPLHVANKVVLNMIKRGSGAGCSEFNWLFVSENENGAKLQLLRNFRSFKRLDENPNMKRIGITRMMKIPSSTLNTILAKRTTLESACNDGNSSTRKQIRSGNFSELEETLPIPTRTAAALEAMDTVRRYVCSFNVDENVINQLSKIDTGIKYQIQCQTRQIFYELNYKKVFCVADGTVVIQARPSLHEAYKYWSKY
ncbi:hypothetical protein T4C_3699 [Trichinella pseudospiralis]|uniref:Uncharacterized protein n=1 Tax=Trichinella pseudospiralis TaxID=6337 RepID=A0A0V1J7P2_TRIPS|nr:hypothetical protein T4C_3699 [Trichinella pseudospiralis]